MTGAILLLVLAGNPAAGSQDTLDTALAQYSQRCNASKPDLDACLEAAWIHVSGRTSTPDLAKARRMLEKACNAGRLRGCVILGNIYVNGNGVPVDKPRAVKYFESACAKRPM
jgi:uncharacterized protein